MSRFSQVHRSSRGYSTAYYYIQQGLGGSLAWEYLLVEQVMWVGGNYVVDCAGRLVP